MRLNVLSPTLHRVEPYFLECSAKLCSPAWGANTGERVTVKEPTVALQIQSGALVLRREWSAGTAAKETLRSGYETTTARVAAPGDYPP